MKRTKYMQDLLTRSYGQVAIIAIQSGTIEGSWEKAIAGLLELDFKHEISEAEVILQSTDFDAYKAAELIRASIPVVQNEMFYEQIKD